ncbi:MAG TPA: FAD-binding oxidoreductase [Acidobacteriota bacterium]|nr:FAD-binding oxidoreductase [Acidobacteriota bacterium]
MSANEYRNLSLWHDTVAEPLEPRAGLTADEQVDVVIVGAGFTGLWTAYYLTELRPGIRIAVLEAEIAGFGASGRNGGWCLGTMAGIGQLLHDPAQRDGAIRLQRALFETVDEVERVCAQENIKCQWARAGNITVATSKTFHAHVQEELDDWRALGATEDEVRWMKPEECSSHIRTARNFGGVFLSYVAALHPARLVRGLARAVERRGVTIYERSPALSLEPRRVRTRNGAVTADVVVRAAEGYTHTISGQKRKLIPVHSMMIATEPLRQSIWDEIGFVDRVTFSDPRRMVTYGQRTEDDRLAFGCRGAYFFGSRVRDRFSPGDAAFAQVRDVLESFFPVLRDQLVTHRWGGAIGVPRNWRPAVGIDRQDGMAWGGGYVGEGVGPSNLVGRTLADLILERPTDLVELPIVERDFRNWEPEPLRWIGARALTKIAESLDATELRDRPTPRIRNSIFEALVRK